MELFGYIFQEYVEIVPNAKIEKIELKLDNTILEKGERKKLEVLIEPEEASSHKVSYSSSNPNIASIDKNGNIHAISSGETIITVKSEESDVQAEISISVHTSIEKLTIDQTEFYMQIGDTFKINTTLEPKNADNKNIIYTSSNESIASVDNAGIITAKAEGEAVILVTSEENNNIKTECKLIVIQKLTNTEIQFAKPLTLNSMEITGIEYNKNSVLDIKEKITTNYEIEIIDKNGKILEDTDRVGTGSKILIKQDNNILAKYLILLYGDVNGDARIDSIDLLVLQRHILQIEEIKGIYKKAGNIAKDGGKLTAIDILLIQRHILEIQFLNQTS